MCPYSLSAFEILMRLNPFLTARAIVEFMLVSLIYKLIYVPEDNFESWGIRRFGRTLYNLCFGNYTEKVWKIPAKEISFRFASEKVRGINFMALVRKMLRIRGQSLLTSFWTDWIYPVAGSYDIYERMRKAIVKNGGKVLLNVSISRIYHDNGKITSVEFEKDGAIRKVPCEWLISTGRKGLFLQNDIHDSVRMGLDSAKLIAGKHSENGGGNPRQ